MQIIADENMPLVRELFAPLAKVRCLPGRSLTRADLEGADALLVRSVTQVTPELLAGTPVRFVGTATIGTDHLDLPGLAAMGVTVASAPGCNALAVSEYVATALLQLAHEQGWRPAERCVGVVGLGNVGGAVASLLRRLGFRVLGCDPFLPQQTPEHGTLLDIDAVIDVADIVCLHTPLTREGDHPTWHLLDQQRLARLRPDCILLNAGRGAVIDNHALLNLLEHRQDLHAVLDVWEGEPLILRELVGRVCLGTPHVAGYSQEGKWRGTAMVHEAFCQFFEQHPPVRMQDLALPAGPLLHVPPGLSGTGLLAHLLGLVCPLQRDDAALRRAVAGPSPGAAFDALRRDYPARHECASHPLQLPGVIKDDDAALLVGAGFVLP
ncbi:MAG: 4-phosphoerythronate dehydrogenase [Moraxellaceae bacterium]|nr:4-phosphoerythronate dehydrogenase [Moraxellaceae bacterium]